MMFMKKIIAACAALSAYKLLTPLKAHAWFAATHRYNLQGAVSVGKRG